jgi:hypothetical protein
MTARSGFSARQGGWRWGGGRFRPCLCAGRAYRGGCSWAGAGLRGWHGAPGESDRVIGVVVVALLVLLAGVIIVAMG